MLLTTGISESTPLKAVLIDLMSLLVMGVFYLLGFFTLGNLATLAAPLGLFTFGAVFGFRGLILGAFRLLILVLHFGLGLVDVLKSLCAEAGRCEQKNAVPFICTTMSAPR